MLPDKVIIGCYEYQVVETDDPIIVSGEECTGEINYRTKVIRIQKKRYIRAGKRADILA